MASLRIVNAHLVTPEGVRRGGVLCEEGRISNWLPADAQGDIDLEGAYLLPGLIDLHTHPIPDLAGDPGDLARLCDDVRARGVAGFLFATGNIPLKEARGFLARLRTTIDRLDPDRGCLGIHLEGPYVSHEMRGGFSLEAIATPAGYPVERLLDCCGTHARYINIAPELPGAVETIRRCRARGIAVSIGHSDASRSQLLAARDAGAQTICHLFNTGRIMRHQEPGVLDVTLDLFGLSDETLTCELICDGIHVDPMLVRLARRVKGSNGIALITDSLIGGRPAAEGQYIPGAITGYRVVNGAARDPQGGLCGSTLTMAQAVQNYAAITNCGFEEAAMAASTVPARILGISQDYGSIELGRRAVFCVLDENFVLRADLSQRVNGIESVTESPTAPNGLLITTHRATGLNACLTRQLKEWSIEIFGRAELEYAWAPPDWRLLTWRDRQLVSHVAVVDRSVNAGGEPIRVAGISGVMTPAQYRGQGLASGLMQRAATFMRDELNTEFGLLLCGAALIPFYEALGWQRITAPVTFDQPGGSTRWRGETMILPCTDRSWPEGPVDLCGLPW